MRSSRSFRAAIAAFAVLALAVPAQRARAQALPTAKALLEKHDAAVGGRVAMEKHSSMHQTVSIVIAAANMTGSMETFQSKPNLYLLKQQTPAGEVVSGFDGKTAWLVAGAQGASILDSSATAELKQQADFFNDYYDPTRIKSAETMEVTDFEGKRCYKVKIVHKDNSESMVFLDSATGLRAGQMETAKMMGQDMQRTLVMTDYKDYGGVLMPTKRLMKLPMFEIQMEVKGVEFDNVPPATYALPDAVKALVKP
jgi:hypothetical protein